MKTRGDARTLEQKEGFQQDKRWMDGVSPQSTVLPLITNSKLILALRPSPCVTVLGNPARTLRGTQPGTETQREAVPGSGSQVRFLPAPQLEMCSLVSGLSQASGIRLVYEPAYTKSKQFITADFPWSRLAVAPLASQLPACTRCLGSPAAPQPKHESLLPPASQHTTIVMF